MIQSPVGLQQSIDSLGMMYRALAGLHARVAPLNQTNYRLLAEGPIDEICRLQRDIHEYLQLESAFASNEAAAAAPATASIATDVLRPAEWAAHRGEAGRSP